MIGNTGIPSRSGLRLDSLGVAHTGFIAAMILHNTDHLRQARGIGGTPTPVFWAGMALMLAAFASFGLTMRRHPRAPVVATVVGFAAAFGAAASHLAPHWSALSDPYADLSLDAYSWVVMVVEVVAGLVLGLVGLRTLRQETTGIT
jgi:hypothetical protein